MRTWAFNPHSGGVTIPPSIQADRRINEEMKLAAAYAIAGCIAPRERHPEYIVPSVFNREVVKSVAAVVEKASDQDRSSEKEAQTLAKLESNASKNCYTMMQVAQILLICLFTLL